MAFKYTTEIKLAGLDNCPPEQYTQMPLTAFRFVFNEISHPDNFRPIGLLHPQRINEFTENAQKCQSLGLSMFAENLKARQFYNLMLLKTAGKFANTVGSCLVELKLEGNDGVHSYPSNRRDSHFTFHEFEHTNLVERIINIKNL